MDQPPITPIEPTFEQLPGMEMAGIATFGGPPSGLFPALWSNFPANVDNQPGLSTQPYCYGVELYPPGFPKKFEFTYVAAGQVVDASKLPFHLLRFSVPAGQYAVFRVPGNIAEAVKIIGQAFRYAYDQWLPNSGYKMPVSLDLERYNSQKGTVEILLPVIQK